LVKTEINPSNNDIYYYFSGYPLGTFNFIRKYEGGQQSFTFMLFEIPLKYGRQISMVELVHPDHTIVGNYPVWTVPPSGNVSELNMESLSAQESLDIFTAPEAVGKQMVIKAVVDGQPTDDFHAAYKAAINQLINTIKGGRATDIIINTWSFLGPPVVFPEELKKH
jgi:hypothetical protein